jgi:predicted metal-dependent peptidase
MTTTPHPMALSNENHERSLVPTKKFAPQEDQKLEELMAWLVFHQPFFAHMLMAQLPIVGTEAVPVAATDSFKIMINPEPFFKYSIKEQAYIKCHEVMHCVLNDPIMMQNWLRRGTIHINGKDVEADAEAINMSMDYIINALLNAAGVGQMPSDALYDPNLSEKGVEAMVDIYEEVLKRKKQGGFPGKGGKPGTGGFDILIAPEQDPDTGQDQTRDELTWAQTVAAAAQAAEAQGKLPGALKKLIGEILDPKVSWQEHLRASVMRASGSDTLDWSTPDRRMMSRAAIGHDNVFFGKASGFGCGTAVVGYDSSGSMIDDKTQQVLFSELHGIFADLNPRELIVIFCDAAVHRVDYIEEVEQLEDARTEGVPGGGGTDFRPVFDEIEKRGIQPDILVYLTDLYGTFPEEEPAYPVVWGSITPGTAPFGETVHIEL